LEAVADASEAEIMLQKLLRTAYWSTPQIAISLPILSETQVTQVVDLLPKAQVPKTALLASSILFHTYLQPGQEWNGAFVKTYFDTYGSPEENHFYMPLNKECMEKIQAKILEHFEKNAHKEIVSLYEDLPGILQKKLISKPVQWALAESYRSQSQAEKSVPFYQALQTERADLARAFMTQFWIASLGAQFLSSQIQKDKIHHLRNSRSQKVFRSRPYSIFE
jgi:hypothetical protein